MGACASKWPLWTDVSVSPWFTGQCLVGNLMVIVGISSGIVGDVVIDEFTSWPKAKEEPQSEREESLKAELNLNVKDKQLKKAKQPSTAPTALQYR